LTCCTFLVGNLIKSKKLVFNNKGVKEGEKKNNNTFWRRVNSMQRGWVFDDNSLSAIFFLHVVNCISSKQRENWHKKLDKQTLKVKMVRTIQVLINSEWFKLLLVNHVKTHKLQCICLQTIKCASKFLIGICTCLNVCFCKTCSWSLHSISIVCVPFTPSKFNRHKALIEWKLQLVMFKVHQTSIN
jgi:hypothetical protein